MRVLIAHRSELLSRGAAEVLERMGCDVIRADDPVDAIGLCETAMPDVALIEAALPGAPGRSLFEQIRDDERFGGLRVILFAEDLDYESAFAGLSAGVDEYLVAPVSFAEVAVRVNTTARMIRLEAQLEDQRAELREMVHIDPVTGLFDRRYLVRQLPAQINAARRSNIALSILLVDLDNFKAINDVEGHAAGDEALKSVGRILAERLRDTDVVGRWGGDEFLVIMPATPADAALEIARKLCDTVRDMRDFPELTLSIGCTGWNEDGPEELVARADLALYEVKAAGRDGAALAPEPVIEVAVPPPLEATVDRPPLRVVIADDVEGIRSLLRITLEGPAVEIVGEGENGEQAIDLVDRLHPDVVVMDWSMPVLDGLAATRILIERHPSLQVVAFTSTSDIRIVRAFLEAGAVSQFDKANLPELAAYLGKLHASP